MTREALLLPGIPLTGLAAADAWGGLLGPGAGVVLVLLLVLLLLLARWVSTPARRRRGSARTPGPEGHEPLTDPRDPGGRGHPQDPRDTPDEH